jgi:hypothetical protein
MWINESRFYIKMPKCALSKKDSTNYNGDTCDWQAFRLDNAIAERIIAMARLKLNYERNVAKAVIEYKKCDLRCRQ